MPIAPDFTSILERKHRIEFTECLPNGSLRLTDLCNILQLAAGEHAEMGGIAFSDMQKHDQAWVLSRMRVEISKLPKWKDEIRVKTWIVNLENSRSIRALELYSGDEKIIGCETFWAVFNTSSRRPEPLALAHDHFDKFAERFSTDDRTLRIDLGKSFEKIADHTVLLSDLDIVNHANNVKYLEWCLDYFDANVLLANRVRSIDMNFMKEVVLGDAVEIYSSRNEKGATFTVSKDGKACLALEVTA